ncbi:alpha/beta-Hydrolases superfamily protein [Striga asiatica]|uniref:Alpha/beta-Hydrolases superfamily protein n=1 Tax=Striga asiatica TaxID=4170 RepID=A0A5A7P6P2_STRAF|nr:alpha/beta-Hydrolases superfamily protein [Striga asiatica]
MFKQKTENFNYIRDRTNWREMNAKFMGRAPTITQAHGADNRVVDTTRSTGWLHGSAGENRLKAIEMVKATIEDGVWAGPASSCLIRKRGSPICGMQSVVSVSLTTAAVSSLARTHAPALARFETSSFIFLIMCWDDLVNSMKEEASKELLNGHLIGLVYIDQPHVTRSAQEVVQIGVINLLSQCIKDFNTPSFHPSMISIRKLRKTNPQLSSTPKHVYNLATVERDKNLSEAVANGMREKGDSTHDQCKGKWKDLVNRYKALKSRLAVEEKMVKLRMTGVVEHENMDVLRVKAKRGTKIVMADMKNRRPS